MSETTQQERQWPIVVGAMLVFAALSTYCSLASQGFLEADSCAHYLYARFAIQFPYYLVNVWGRPVCTGVYAIPALLGGRAAVHVVSLLLALGCAGLAFVIARELKARWAALALLFTLAQPLVFLHSFSELTELPFAFLLALSAACWLRGRYFALALVAGFLPLSRPEGFGFVILIAGLCLIGRRFWQILLLPIPLMIWSYAGHVLYGSHTPWWHWLIDEWPYSATSLYQRGSLFHFLLLMPAVASPFIFPATVIGVVQMFKKLTPSPLQGEGRGEGTSNIELLTEPKTDPHPNPLPANTPGEGAQTLANGLHWKRLVIVAIPLLVFAGHSVLYSLGKMASSGEVRYMLIVAPFWGVLGAFGWEKLFARLPSQIAYRWAAVAAAIPLAFNGVYRVLPLTLDEEWHSAQLTVDWYRTSGVAARYPKLACAQQEVLYLLDVAPADGRHIVEYRRDVMDHPPAGTIAIFHPMYSIFNADSNRSVPLEELLRSGWIDITDRQPVLGKGWHILLSPQALDGSATPTTQRSPSSP